MQNLGSNILSVEPVERPSDASEVRKNANDQPFDEVKIFKRLMELKELYEIQRRELGLPPSKDFRHTRIQPDSSSDESGEEITHVEGEEGNDDHDESRGHKRRRSDPAAVTGQPIQALIRGIIERHGGSCHFDTIVENVKMRWQRESICKSDGSPYGHADCKKAVQNCLKARVDNRFIYAKDKDNEGCWTLAEVQEDDYDVQDKYPPLFAVITDSIEEHGGVCHLDDMYAYLKENWHPQPPSDGIEYTTEEKELQVRITLSTSPKFMEDEDNPDFYTVTKKKRKASRREASEVKPSSPYVTLNGRTTRKSSKMDDDTEESERHAVNRRGNNKSWCTCGPVEAGKGIIKWKRSPSGEFLCTTCGLSMHRKHACPVCGKAYKKDEAGDENAWIRCDDCHKWVMIQCDKITDISVFDDSNPNHLHYSCPICRGDFLPYLPKQDDVHTKSVLTRNGAKKAKEADGDEDETQLEITERQILDKIAEEFDTTEDQSVELQETVKQQGASFAEEITQYAAQLVGKRERELSKNQMEYEKKLKRLKEDKEKAASQIEVQCILELKDYYAQQRKIYKNKKQTVLQNYSRSKE